MGLDWIKPSILKELVEAFTKPLYIIYHQSWITKMAPFYWRLSNVTSTRRARKIYRPVSLTLVPEKVMEQIILSTIT